MLVPTNESKKKKKKKCEELWKKIGEYIWPMTKSSDDYDETYMKVKSNSDYELPLNKMTEVFSLAVVVKAVFS